MHMPALTLAREKYPAKSAAAKAKPRAKTGRFRKAPPTPPPCHVPVKGGAECGQPSLARGMCRKHYDRWRKHGDPQVLARAGAASNIPPALTEAGITARQRNHWAATGVIAVPLDGRSGKYIWSVDHVEMALIVKRLSDLGFPLDIAGSVAEAAVKHRTDRVEIADGIVIELDLPDLEPPL